jgi:hypothetical protein
VPDQLRDGAASGEMAAPPPPIASPAAPPPIASAVASEVGGRPPRRPSWLRAALFSLVILAAGTALGAAGYRLEHGAAVRPPDVAGTAGGWSITARHGREFSGLALSGTKLLWQDGAAIEYLELESGRLRLLGPGPGMHTTWDPAVGERYAVWFEAERQASIAAQAVAYDTRTGRRWTVAEIGSVRSYPAISGDVAVWCSDKKIGAPSINGVRIGGGEMLDVADGSGAPVVSGGLVVWATSWTGPFVAKGLVNGSSWPVTATLTSGRLTGIALSGRTLVWGQATDTSGSGVVAAAGVDGGGTRRLASGVTGLAGPAYDGTTIVWGEKTVAGGRVLGRRPGSGAAFVIADVVGAVKEVAVSGDTVAWIEASGDASYSIVVAELPK